MKVTTSLKRYYRWKYSGPITVFGVFALLVIVWIQITSFVSFYDKFTCPQMIDYYKDDHQRIGMPKYSELPVSDQQKIESERNKCVEMGWSPNIGK